MANTISISNLLSRSAAYTAIFALSFMAPVHISAAQAQVPDTQTTIADPGRVEEHIQTPKLTPDVSPRVDVEKLELLGAPAGAENIRFALSGIKVEGVTVYTEEELQAVYADRLGQTISLAELYGIANSLTTKYRNEGYILTQVVVPPQTIDAGVPKLKVVEGYIDQVIIDGDEQKEGAALDVIRKYAGKLASNGPLNAKDLERALLLINDLPGVTARSILSPSTQPGAADLRIVVERDRYDALLSVDTNGSRYLGPLEFIAAGSVNSLFQNNEKISGQFVFAPDNDPTHELMYGSVSYWQPLWSQGTSLEVLGSVTDTRPGYDLDRFDVHGQSRYASVKVEHPFIRSRDFNLTGRVLFDWRDIESKNNLEPTRQDRLRVLRTGGRLEFLETYFGVGINAFDVELSQGLNVFGASEEGAPNLTRAAGDPTFTKLTAEAQRLQKINNRINLLLAVRGQLSSNKLLSSEEFGFGGINYGRGYDPSEIVGDEGVAGKLEVQWNEPYDISLLENYQLFSFLDAGRTWNEDASTSSRKKDALSSAGFGIRADFTAETTAGLMVAFPINEDIQTQGDKDPRVYFNLSRRF